MNSEVAELRSSTSQSLVVSAWPPPTQLTNKIRTPKISIMLITYNHEKYIAQAIESILMQETEYDYEINVIEDCSTDRTQEVIMRYVEMFPDIVKPYFNKKNIGYKVTQKNFYRGFQTLKGDYLAILEGDDYWSSPHKLQKQVGFLEAHPDFALCAHNTIKVYEDGSQQPHRFLYWGQLPDASVEDVIKLRFFFHTTGIIYRNVFKGVPPPWFRNEWSCDIFIMIAHAQFGKAHHMDEDMAVYRAHAAGRFSTMSLLDGWVFNIGGLRRYNEWLGYRYIIAFSHSIARYCIVVLKQSGKAGIPNLAWHQFVEYLSLFLIYGSFYCAFSLPGRIHAVFRRSWDATKQHGVLGLIRIVTSFLAYRSAIFTYKLANAIAPGRFAKFRAAHSEVRQIGNLLREGKFFNVSGAKLCAKFALKCTVYGWRGLLRTFRGQSGRGDVK